MTLDSLQMLAQLFATETNPHQLVQRVVAESPLLEEARRLSRDLLALGSADDARIMECCRLSKIPIEFFWERLQLVARILNLIPYDQDYYEILGIERRASQHEIKQAFRRLSFACHPDTNPHDPQAAERFNTLQHAYQVLSHDLLRKRYNHNLSEHLWEDEAAAGGRLTGSAWWGKWRKTWPLCLLILLLVATTFVVDYSQWQTERYYAARKTLPLNVEPDNGLISSKAPARKADEASPRAPSVPEAPVPKPAPRPPSAREPAEALSSKSILVFANEQESPGGQEEKPGKAAFPSRTDSSLHTGRTPDEPRGTGSAMAAIEPPKPVEAAPPATESAGRQITPPHPPVGSSQKESAPEAITVPPPVAATAKAAPQKLPPPPFRSETEPQTAKVQENLQQAAPGKAGTATAAAAALREPSPESPARSASPGPFTRMENLDQEIRTFLSRYTSTYEARDMSAFMRLFEANAVENGRPIQELVPVYQANFRRAEKLRYRINVGRWEIGEGEVMVDGSFSLAVQFEQEAPVESKGSIQLTLVRRAGDFGVKRLNYVFKESRKTAP